LQQQQQHTSTITATMLTDRQVLAVRSLNHIVYIFTSFSASVWNGDVPAKSLHVCTKLALLVAQKGEMATGLIMTEVHVQASGAVRCFVCLRVQLLAHVAVLHSALLLAGWQLTQQQLTPPGTASLQISANSRFIA